MNGIKHYALFCLSVITGLTSTGFCQQIQWNKGQTFTEAVLTQKRDEKSWTAVKPGLHSSFVTIDKRYDKY